MARAVTGAHLAESFESRQVDSGTSQISLRYALDSPTSGDYECVAKK